MKRIGRRGSCWEGELSGGLRPGDSPLRQAEGRLFGSAQGRLGRLSPHLMASAINKRWLARLASQLFMSARKTGYPKLGLLPGVGRVLADGTVRLLYDSRKPRRTRVFSDD